MQLRPYQQDCLNQLRAEVAKGNNPLLVAPCGSGKGSLIAYIVQSAVSKGYRVIFAVHGKSLVVDMSERVAKLGIEHGVLMGGEKRQHWHPVQVASIDTLHRMSHPPGASLIIADEADGAMSPTWLKALGRYPNARIIGATATPCRSDGKPLGRAAGGIFDSLVLGPNESELINMGYLVDARVLAPPPPPDLKLLRKTAGEFNPKQSAAICDKAKVIGDIVEHWRKHAFGRKTVSFGVDKAHAQHIADQFNAVGVPFAYVDADTPLDERAKIWKDLDSESGTLMGVSSCGVCLIGWDRPIVSCIVDAAKTASLRKHKQKLGRGSRTYRGKDCFVVLDHVSNVHYHEPYGLFSQTPPWTLDGEAMEHSDADKTPSITTCRKCFFTFRSGPTHCPACNAELPRSKRKVEVEAGELQEVVAGTVATGGPRPGDKELFLKFFTKAVLKGYKPAWAIFAFRGVRGYVPPRQWTEEFSERTRMEEVTV